MSNAKKKTISLLASFFAIAGLAIGGYYLDTLKPSDVHQSVSDKECLECHADMENYDGKKKINPSKIHDTTFKNYTHGDHAYNDLFSCTSCHTQKDCVDCHAAKPSSHTETFMKPLGDGIQKHALLAEMNTDSCVTCHQATLKEDCESCHTMSELDGWRRSYDNKLDWSKAR